MWQEDDIIREGGRQQGECACSVLFQEAFLVASDSNNGCSKLSLGALPTLHLKEANFNSLLLYVKNFLENTSGFLWNGPPREAMRSQVLKGRLKVHLPEMLLKILVM